MTRPHLALRIRLVILVFLTAYLGLSCTDQSATDRSFVLASGELVRAVVADGDRSISGASALCLEITIIEELVTDWDYLSFDDLVSNVDLMAGWSNAEVRLDGRLEKHFYCRAPMPRMTAVGQEATVAAPRL